MDSVRLELGSKITHYVLVLPKKTVVFDPHKNLYSVLLDDTHNDLKSKINTFESKSELLSTLKTHFKCLSNATGISVNDSVDLKEAEVVSFNQRFTLFLAAGDPDSKKIKPLLFLLAAVGITIGNVFLRLGLFKLLLGSGRGRRESKTFDMQIATLVGHNIALASKFSPFTLDCKTLAFTFKFVLSFLGYKCDVAIGIQDNPFFAHMWATIGEKPLGESPEVTSEFQLIYNSSW